MEPEETDDHPRLVDSESCSESWERVQEDSDAMPPECVGAPKQRWT